MTPRKMVSRIEAARRRRINAQRARQNQCGMGRGVRFARNSGAAAGPYGPPEVECPSCRRIVRLKRVESAGGRLLWWAWPKHSRKGPKTPRPPLVDGCEHCDGEVRHQAGRCPHDPERRRHLAYTDDDAPEPGWPNR